MEHDIENKCLERDEMVVLLFAYINHLNYAKNLLDAYNSIFNCRRSEEKLQIINHSSVFLRWQNLPFPKLPFWNIQNYLIKRKLRIQLDTVGKNTSRIAEYISNQLKEDALSEQLTINEVGPFTGSR